MGEIRLPYRFTPSTPKRNKKSSSTTSSKKLLWFLASPASPSSSPASIRHRTSSSSSSSGCFYTPRTTDASFERKLGFDDDNDVIESNEKNAVSSHRENKMHFFNSLNIVLSMKGRKVIEKMKKIRFALMVVKENHESNINEASCDHEVWYDKEVKGIRCKPIGDGSFRFAGKLPAVVQSPAVVVVEDEHAF